MYCFAIKVVSILVSNLNPSTYYIGYIELIRNYVSIFNKIQMT